MKPEELMQECIETINRSTENGMSSPKIYVTVEHKNSKRNFCYPFGRGAPKARIHIWNQAGRDVVSFDALDLLAYLIAVNGYSIKEAGE